MRLGGGGRDPEAWTADDKAQMPVSQTGRVVCRLRAGMAGCSGEKQQVGHAGRGWEGRAQGGGGTPDLASLKTGDRPAACGQQWESTQPSPRWGDSGWVRRADGRATGRISKEAAKECSGRCQEDPEPGARRPRREFVCKMGTVGAGHVPTQTRDSRHSCFLSAAATVATRKCAR